MRGPHILVFLEFIGHHLDALLLVLQETKEHSIVMLPFYFVFVEKGLHDLCAPFYFVFVEKGLSREHPQLPGREEPDYFIGINKWIGIQQR
jgi:hypothetical protein